MRLLLLWLGAATLTRAAHFQDDWVMEYPRPSGAQDSPDADLAIRVDFSSLKGPGQRLLNGIAMGVTSAREVFESQGAIVPLPAACSGAADRQAFLDFGGAPAQCAQSGASGCRYTYSAAGCGTNAP